MKKFLLFIGILVIILIAIFLIYPKTSLSPIKDKNAFDPKNSSFTIENNSVQLKNSVGQIQMPEGEARTVKYFGNEAKGDLNNDGLKDQAFLVTDSGSGSGTFYYVVAAIKVEEGYKYTNAFFVGDRIAPQTTEIISGELRVNYVDRKPNEPMTATPSIGSTLLLKVTPAGVLEGLMK